MSSDLGVGSGHHRTTNIETYTVQYIYTGYLCAHGYKSLSF